MYPLILLTSSSYRPSISSPSPSRGRVLQLQTHFALGYTIIPSILQEEYEREGIKGADVSYKDNRSLLDLLLKVSSLCEFIDPLY